jgi:hypothetical protein
MNCTMTVKALLEATAVLLRIRPFAELWLLIVIKLTQIDNGIEGKSLINTVEGLEDMGDALKADNNALGHSAGCCSYEIM